MRENNPFTLTFGQQPKCYIQRKDMIQKIMDQFISYTPLTHIQIITGIRGSGKTVILSDLSKKFKELDEWIVIDINPNREILEQVASGIYEAKKIKHLFLKKTFSFSFHGIGLTLEGKEPISSTFILVKKMLDICKKRNKKVLLSIDEVTSNTYTKSFFHDFQTLLREDYDLFIVMDGLPENVYNLQNIKTLTFLYRSPKEELLGLYKSDILFLYQKVFHDANINELETLSDLTKGYAFAFQVAGMLFYDMKKIDDKFLLMFDQLISQYVYDKIWDSLPCSERKILSIFKNKTRITNKQILKETKMSINQLSVYKDRLFKRGLIDTSQRGIIKILPPRFNLYASKRIDETDF